MRISELSRASGVPVSSIKFYIREGLLPPGDGRQRTQATYGDDHLRRLELIRVLREVADLGVDRIREVLSELERGWEGDPVGAALRPAASGVATVSDDSEAAALREEVRGFVDGLEWALPEYGSHFPIDTVAEALSGLRTYLSPEIEVADLSDWADVAWLLSAVNFAWTPGDASVPSRAAGDDLVDPTRRAVIGTILVERIFTALLRGANAMRSIRISNGLPVPPTRVPHTGR